jgi:opacity protein-like surface antigen
MVELRLPIGFAIEADALYSQANLSSVIEAAGSLVSAATDANSWEFPVVLKKKFGGADAIAASVRPYVEAGASFRKFTGLKDLPAFVTGSGGNIDSNNTGFVIGGGLEIRALFLRVSPEVRFTRWGSDNFLGGLANVWKTNRNQGQFLVGISF